MKETTYYNIHFHNGDVKKFVSDEDVAKIKEVYDAGSQTYIWVGEAGLDFIDLDLIAFIIPAHDDYEV